MPILITVIEILIQECRSIIRSWMKSEKALGPTPALVLLVSSVNARRRSAIEDSLNALYACGRLYFYITCGCTNVADLGLAQAQQELFLYTIKRLGWKCNAEYFELIQFTSAYLQRP
jgi:hypothetical protein